MPLYYMRQTFERIFVVYFHSINSILAIKEKGRERAYSRRNSTEYEKPEMQSIWWNTRSRINEATKRNYRKTKYHSA